MTAPTGASSESARRFHLAIQRTRYYAYAFSFGAFFIGKWLGAFPGTKSWHAFLMLGLAFALVGSAHAAYHFRLDTRLGIDLTPGWLACDLVLATASIWLTGGATSPWFIWYIGLPSVAAFTMGRAAAHVMALLNLASYLLVLYLVGDLRTTEDVYLALVRMFLLWAASFFPLEGVVKLQERRVQIKQLREQDAKKLADLTALNEELTRVAAELDRRTQELATANQRLSDANATIQKQDRLKSEFLANMSHELRTPLNAIIGFADVLSSRLEGQLDAKHLGFQRSILDSGRHLLNVINDILDLSKIEAGKMEFFPESFDAAQPVRAVCDLVGVNAEPRGVSIRIESPDALPAIETDLGKFKQILFNLLSNAVKFSPDGGIVTVRIRPLSTRALAISVTDQGEGIERDEIETIFEDFAQVTRTARSRGGTGLGLALVRRYLEKLGGRIEVDSIPGSGSTFTFSLPLVYEVEAGDT
jgi:signal transduction histidine kinase